MKKSLLLLPVCMLALCGCAHQYVVTMTNGTRITTSSKPKLQKGSYVYKDARGQPVYIPAGRVRVIEPASMAKDEKDRFRPTPGP
jgi:hypothetical protein